MPTPQPIALRILTFAVVLVAAYIFLPVLSGITWGLAFAVVAWPWHRRMRDALDRDTLSAAISTSILMLAIVVPIVLVSMQLVQEAKAVKIEATQQVQSGEWRTTVTDVPYVGSWLLKQIEGVSPEQAARTGLARLSSVAMPVAGGVGAFTIQTLVAGFVLFFAFKDGARLIVQVQDALPLPRASAARLTDRMGDAVVATLAGTILTGLIQGVTGGLMFWFLGLPAAVLWGVVMFVVSVLPVLGAFLVWLPAAIYLAMQGDYGKAAALVTWGILMAGPICNYVYARTAGGKMEMHPAVTLLAFVGGLAAFGIAGMVLGPVLVVVAAELISLWERRAGLPVEGAEPRPRFHAEDGMGSATVGQSESK